MCWIYHLCRHFLCVCVCVRPSIRSFASASAFTLFFSQAFLHGVRLMAVESLISSVTSEWRLSAVSLQIERVKNAFHNIFCFSLQRSPVLYYSFVFSFLFALAHKSKLVSFYLLNAYVAAPFCDLFIGSNMFFTLIVWPFPAGVWPPRPLSLTRDRWLTSRGSQPANWLTQVPHASSGRRLKILYYRRSTHAGMVMVRPLEPLPEIPNEAPRLRTNHHHTKLTFCQFFLL